MRVKVEKWKISCATCGKDIELFPGTIKCKLKEGKRVFYCSTQCATKHNYLSMQVKGIDKTWTYSCAICGKEVTKPMHEIINKLDSGGRTFFCSKKCAGQGKTVSLHSLTTYEDLLIREENAKDKQKEYSKKYYTNNKEKLKNKADKYQKDNREKHNEYNRKTKRTYRRRCLEHYGLKCECCGESIYEFLTIDHINGGGNKHRKEIGKKVIYKWLIDNNFPDGYRTLCYNCNSSIGHYGYCPHQLNRKK